MQNKFIGTNTTKGTWVLEEITIHISDEKLKNALSKSYEYAQRDLTEFKIYKHYDVLFSFSLTLILAIITSDFHDAFGIPANTILTIFIFLTIISTFLGVVFMKIAMHQKHKNDISKRDKAVNEVFRKYCSNNKNTE